MTSIPILLMGGSGAIGILTAHALRAAHPDVPILIGGRNIDRAREAARAIGGAQGVVIDPQCDDLGLGRQPVRAVAVFYADERLAGLRFAHARGIPHLGISSGVYEIAPEIAIFMQNPQSAAMVLGYEWLVGATTVATLSSAAPFARIDDIAIGALVDEQDRGGPAVEEDFERLTRMMPSALTRRDGKWTWRSGVSAEAEFTAIDGTRMDALGFSSIDVTGLAAATGAANVQFNLAIGVSSSRRRGDRLSTEIIVELAGEDWNGHPLRIRDAVFHPDGTAPLTAIGVSMLLERLAGLGVQKRPAAGLYFPYQLLDRTAYLTRLRADGGDILKLDPV